MPFKQFQGTVSQDWSDPANWMFGQLPDAGDDVVVFADATVSAGTFSYGSLVGFLGATIHLAPGAVVQVHETYLLGSNISGGTLEPGVLAVIAGEAEGTTLRDAAIASGFSSADLGISGVISVDDQLDAGTNVLAVSNGLTVAAATELQFGEIDIQGRLVFAGTGASAVLTVDPAAVLRAGSAADVTVGPGRVVNGGMLAVDAGTRLTMAATLVNTGSIALAAGAVLDLTGAETVAQLGVHTGAGQLMLSGILDETGASFSLASLGSAVLGDAATGATVLGGTLLTAGQVLHPDAAGPATILRGVAVQGLLDIAGGNTTLAGGTTLTAGFGGRSGAVRLESGTLTLDGYGTLDDLSIELDGGVLTATAATQLGRDTTLLIGGNATLGGNVVVTGDVTIEAGDRLSLADGATAATTAIYLEDGATLTAATTLAGTTRFAGTSGLLELSGKGALTATLSQFRAGDAVRLDGMSSGVVSLSGNVLTVSDGTTTASLTLVDGGAAGYTPGSFHLAADSSGRLVLTTTHAETVTADPLFDQGYYLAHNPQVAASGLDPYQHYLKVGGFQGLNPDALFDSAYYLAQNPDVAAAGINPLVHYEMGGWAEGRAPSAMFSAAVYGMMNPAAVGTNALVAAADAAQVAGVSMTAGTADPLVMGDYLLDQLSPALLAAAGVTADAAANAAYKAGGWTKLVNPDPFFDTKYYLERYGQAVAASGLDPLTHYETIGWKQGFDPSLLFSTNAYLAANPDVAGSGIDPLTEYLTEGQAQGRAIHAATVSTPADPLIDTATVAAQLASLLPMGGADPAVVSALYHDGGWRFVDDPSPLFNARYYLAANPDVAAAGIDPLAHYEQSGGAEGRNPSPAFDDRYYLASNPDVAAAGINPLIHFEQTGWHEGRDPNPLFDTKYYLAHNPDVAASGVDPLTQYETEGWQQGRNPSALLDVNYYLSHNPDVAAAHLDPMTHFETSGWHEGRNPDALFDVKYYLAHNPDVAAAGIDPLIHYDMSGWKEGRNPSAAFDTKAYLNANPDVRAAGVDPLAQYLTSGAADGRLIYAVS